MMTGLAQSRPFGGAAVRRRLRAATSAAHERMHAHAGFAAAAAGTINVPDYRRLLARLYGFHRPFEDAVRAVLDTLRIDLDLSVHARSPLILMDLQAFGFDPEAASTLPRWRASLRLVDRGSLLGALYVLEGSSLGGMQIARALSGRLGDEMGRGLFFFLGRGEREGAMWRELLVELESLSEDAGAAAQAEDAAVATFLAFEDWMAGWRAEIGAAVSSSA